MPVGVMLRAMDSREIAEWQAFFMLEHEDSLRRKAEIEAEREREGARRLASPPHF